jgi:glycosyltransferase involved in cell wall biosynthesis
MPLGDQPLVSIGMPVYNGAAHLRGALDALLGQTYRYFELLISDNASTDETPAICEAYAARDSRIRYERNSSNIGATANFQHVLTRANGPLFMWAAHDDLWQPDFIAANVRELLQDPSVIASISMVEFIDIDSWIWKKLWAPYGTSPLLGSVRENVSRVLWNPGTGSRVYGIFRVEALRPCSNFSEVWGSDTTFVIKTLKYGKYAQVPRFLMQRRRGHSKGMRKYVWGHSRTWLSRYLFPFWDATRDILAEEHVPHHLLIYLFLLKLNLMHAVWYYKGCAQDFIAWLIGRRASSALASRPEQAAELKKEY